MHTGFRAKNNVRAEAVTISNAHKAMAMKNTSTTTSNMHNARLDKVKGWKCAARSQESAGVYFRACSHLVVALSGFLSNICCFKHNHIFQNLQSPFNKSPVGLVGVALDSGYWPIKLTWILDSTRPPSRSLSSPRLPSASHRIVDLNRLG